MTTKTHILGKDTALEDSIAHLQQCITDLGFDIEQARWLNPIPNVWSVHIRDKSCPQVFSNGKGATEKAALASAYGELIERLSTRYLWADFALDAVQTNAGFIHQRDEQWLAPDQPWPSHWLDEHWHQRYITPYQMEPADFVDVNGGATGRGVCALPYVRQSDGRECYIPVNMIANLFVSNGMSAGNNRDEALVQGLSEIFERAIKNRIIVEDIALPEVPPSVLEQLPSIQAGLASLIEHGFNVRALDASLGGQYPVMAVILQHPNGGVYASFGAHTQFEVALERALTELLQGRALGELEQFPAPSADVHQIDDPHNIELHFIDSSGVVGWGLLSDQPDVAFYDWHNQPIWSPDNAQSRQQLLDLLHDDGFQVYVCEFTDLGAYACRILVPGFSDIYPADELELYNNNQSLSVRSLIFDLDRCGEAGWQKVLDTFDQYNVNDQLRVCEWMGILGDKQSSWGRIRVGELKVWLLLALKDRAFALDMLPSVLASGHLNDHERSQYRCLQAVLELAEIKLPEQTDLRTSLQPYRKALNYYYSESLVDEAIGWVDGDKVFAHLGRIDAETPSLAHTTLLEAYNNVLSAQDN